jgi:hypothetical protein
LEDTEPLLHLVHPRAVDGRKMKNPTTKNEATESDRATSFCQTLDVDGNIMNDVYINGLLTEPFPIGPINFYHNEP